MALVGLAVLMWLGRTAGGYVPLFAAWVDGLGALGPLVFILGYATATVAFIPGSILTLAAGAIFGLFEGTIYVFVAAVLGSTLAFLIARHAARSAIERRIEGDARDGDNAGDSTALDAQVGGLLLEESEVRLVLELMSDGGFVELPVRLRSGGPDGRSLARVECSELDAGSVHTSGHAAT